VAAEHQPGDCRRGCGLTDENLGRKTNAISGEAIRARQLQGGVVTTEPFDNLRLAVQAQGEKQLSLIEQFYTQEKVIRLTGGPRGLEWVKLNQPEMQADGSVRWLNDITASMADFLVSEADYAGTLRQVMFDAMTQLSQRLPPEVALKFLRMAFQFSDLPNKTEIVDELRRMTGEPDPARQQDPQEQALAQQQAAMQQEAMQLQRALAMAALEEQQAKAREINARAEKLMAETQRLGAAADVQDQIGAAVTQVRERAAAEIEALSDRLAHATADNTAAVLKIKTDADTTHESARLQAEAKVRVAEIQRASDQALMALTRRIEDLAGSLDEFRGKLKQFETQVAEPASARK